MQWGVILLLGGGFAIADACKVVSSCYLLLCQSVRWLLVMNGYAVATYNNNNYYYSAIIHVVKQFKTVKSSQ